MRPSVREGIGTRYVRHEVLGHVGGEEVGRGALGRQRGAAGEGDGGAQAEQGEGDHRGLHGAGDVGGTGSDHAGGNFATHQYGQASPIRESLVVQ